MRAKSITAVYAEGEYRVSQFCAFSGYPQNAGVRILNILKGLDLKELRLACLQCTGITPTEAEQKRREELGRVVPWRYGAWVGPEILVQIVRGGVRDLVVYPEYAFNSYFSDWVYVVDLDAGAFEVYRGDNQEPLPKGARFFSGYYWEVEARGTKQRYYPVRLAASWPLERLPNRNEFLDKLEPLKPAVLESTAVQCERKDTGSGQRGDCGDMQGTDVTNGQYHIFYEELAGFRAPDEDVKRPAAGYELYYRKKTGWLPVQAVIPEGLRSIGDNAFEACYGLTGVTIPDTITRIGKKAFYSCLSLADVTLPDSITMIDDEAFAGCTALARIRLSDALKTIGKSAFARCSGLREIAFPDAIADIGTEAFFYCTALTDVVIPGSVSEIGECCFSGCTALTSLTIDEGVTKIGDGAFDGCTALKQLSLPEAIKIGAHAFSRCSSLTAIRIGNRTKRIGVRAFHGCDALEEVILPEHFCNRSNMERIFGGIQQLSWRWLCGKLQVNEPLAAVLAQDIKSRRTRVWGQIIESGDVGTLERYLALWDKVPLDYLDKRIEKAVGARKHEFTATLLQYKYERYMQERVLSEEGAP